MSEYIHADLRVTFQITFVFTSQTLWPIREWED